MRREKSAFDHINTDWNLPNEDGSTDFSDDDTVIDERVSFFFKFNNFFERFHNCRFFFLSPEAFTSSQFCRRRFTGITFTFLNL